MNPRILLPVFAILVLAQWVVPGTMILQREFAIGSGKEYKFHVRPVDPCDAFRGRYIQLHCDEAAVPIPANTQVTEEQEACITVEKDADGFVVAKALSLTKPDTRNYLKVRVRPGEDGSATFAWPFDRYYMSEFDAPKAEKTFRERGRTYPAYITVRISQGTGVITGLYLDNVPIEQKIAE